MNLVKILGRLQMRLSYLPSNDIPRINLRLRELQHTIEIKMQEGINLQSSAFYVLTKEYKI